MFESIFTTTTDNTIEIASALLCVGAALILGIVIGVAYMFACRKEGYGKNFIVGLALLPAIVAVVILLIGSNVARAFSMAGAFALVRFRSAPGNAKDISVVFFAMAAGLACGLGYVTFAAVFVIILVAALLVLSTTCFAENNKGVKQLKVVIPENLNYTNVFDEVFEKYVSKVELRKVKTTNMGTMFELTYNVIVKKNADEKEFIDALRVRNGNLNVILGMIESDAGVLN